MSFLLHSSQRKTFPVRMAAGGFSLIELLVALTIGIILVGIAAPQFSAIMQKQQASSEINNLLNDMQYARSEAIKQGQLVTLCASSNGTSCSAATTWQAGWIIFSNISNLSPAAFTNGTDVLLRKQAKFTTTDTLTSSPVLSAVTYNRDGFGMNFSSTTGELFTLHSLTASTNSTKCLWLDSLGRQTVQKAGAAALTGQGTNKCV